MKSPFKVTRLEVDRNPGTHSGIIGGFSIRVARPGWKYGAGGGCGVRDRVALEILSTATENDLSSVLIAADRLEEVGDESMAEFLRHIMRNVMGE